MIDTHLAGRHARSRSARHSWSTALSCALLVAGPAVAGAQQPPETRAPKPHTLTVSREGGVYVTLDAEAVKLADIVADLSRRVGTPVTLGASLQNEIVSIAFTQVALEPAMTALAPRVFIDYELRQGMLPTALGIFLVGFNDPEPPRNAVVRGNSQGLFFSGHTEDTGKPSEDERLQVLYDKGKMTVKAKQQPLAAIVMTIADTLAISTEVKSDSVALEAIDVDLKDMAPEDLIPNISPNVRVYTRSDLSRLEKTLLRIVIMAPAAK